MAAGNTVRGTVMCATRKPPASQGRWAASRSQPAMTTATGVREPAGPERQGSRHGGVAGGDGTMRVRATNAGGRARAEPPERRPAKHRRPPRASFVFRLLAEGWTAPRPTGTAAPQHHPERLVFGSPCSTHRLGGGRPTWLTRGPAAPRLVPPAAGAAPRRNEHVLVAHDGS